jgi:hypothetical protein
MISRSDWKGQSKPAGLRKEEFLPFFVDKALKRGERRNSYACNRLNCLAVDFQSRSEQQKNSQGDTDHTKGLRTGLGGDQMVLSLRVRHGLNPIRAKEGDLSVYLYSRAEGIL